MKDDHGFEVDSDAVRHGARTVDQVADAVEDSRSAAGSIQLGRDAYGRLCRLLPDLMDPLQDEVIYALRGAMEALRQTADDLRATAQHYHDSDERSTIRFGANR